MPSNPKCLKTDFETKGEFEAVSQAGCWNTYRQCHEASDCTLVRSPCGGGLGANKRFADAVAAYQAYQLKGLKTACPTKTSEITEAGARCRQGLCQLIDILYRDGHREKCQNNAAVPDEKCQGRKPTPDSVCIFTGSPCWGNAPADYQTHDYSHHWGTAEEACDVVIRPCSPYRS